MLKGFFRLDRIPRSEIRQTENGSVGVFIEIHAKREKDQYGYTHYAKMRIKNASGEYENIYLGDFREEELNLKPANIDLTPLPKEDEVKEEPNEKTIETKIPNQGEENKFPF